MCYSCSNQEHMFFNDDDVTLLLFLLVVFSHENMCRWRGDLGTRRSVGSQIPIRRETIDHKTYTTLYAEKYDTRSLFGLIQKSGSKT